MQPVPDEKRSHMKKPLPGPLPESPTFPSGNLPGLQCFDIAKTPNFLKIKFEFLMSKTRKGMFLTNPNQKLSLNFSKHTKMSKE